MKGVDQMFTWEINISKNKQYYVRTLIDACFLTHGYKLNSKKKDCKNIMVVLYIIL